MAEAFTGLEAEWKEVQRQIEESAFKVFPMPIPADDRNVYWPLEKGIRSFLVFASELGKEIVYAGYQTFDVTDIEDLLSTFSIAVSIIWPEHETSPNESEPYLLTEEDDPDLDTFIQRSRSYLGRVYNFRVEWVHDGIVHSYWRLADWYSYLMGEVADLGSLLEQRNFEQASQREEELEKFSAKFAKDVEFQSRTNRKSRASLIEAHFPDLISHEIWEIERIAWSIYQEDILPEQEKIIVLNAQKLIDSGESITSTAGKLGMTRGKLQRLLARHSPSI